MVAKSEVKKWNNAKGSGQLMSVTFADQSAEIRATLFNEAVEAFGNLLMEHQVYDVSKGTIKVANKMYSNVANDYEMTIDMNTSISVVS